MIRFVLILCLAVLALTGCRSASDAAVVAAEPERAVFHYAPVRASYLAVSRRNVEQDMQGTTQHTETILRVEVASELRPVDSGFEATFTIDSILQLEMPGASGVEARRLEGRRYSGLTSPTGEFTDFDPGTATSPLAQQITNIIEQFFPTVPGDGVEEGSVWTDSTANVGNNGGAEITTTAVTENHAESWTQFLGQDALVVSWVSQYRFTGSGEQLGQPFTIDGSGERRGQHYLGRDGKLLGSISSDSSTAEATIATFGMSIPIRQSAADSILLRVDP